MYCDCQDLQASPSLFTKQYEGRSFLIDHRGLFHICFYCPVLSFSLTPTYSGLRSCSERLAEQMNNSTVLSWVVSDYSSCSISAFFFSRFPAPGLLLSQIFLLKTQRLCSVGKKKARAACLVCNFDH